MFKFTWRIENFSMLLQNTGEFIDSPAFEVKSMNSVKAYIRLYPKGKINNQYVTYYLFKANESTTFEVGTKLMLSFIKNGKLESMEYVIDSSNKQALNLSFERKKILQVHEFQGLFLHADNVDIECVFQKPNSAESPVTCCAKTTVQTETYSDDISLRTFDLSSFWKQSHEYSKYLTLEQSDSFMLVLKFLDQFVNNTLEINNVSAISSETLSLLNTVDKTELFCNTHLFKASSKNESWKISFDINASAIEKFSTFRCEIIASSGNIVSDIETGNQFRTKIYSTGMLDKNCCVLLRNMFDTKKFSDMVLQVGTDQFPVHKCVLGNASDVFSAMFTNKMQEEETNIVNITDIAKDIIGTMLEFIYTGEIGILDLDSMISLYSAADKYQIQELKKLCSFRLTDTLSVDNCLEVLELADMHQDDVLEKAARSYIYANHKELLISSRWKSFMKSHLELSADVMYHICQMP